MPHPSTHPSIPVPKWLMALGSVAVALHFSILGVSVLAAPSGPWPTPFGGERGDPPAFAYVLDEVTRPNYLWPLKMTHNYHFMTNQSERTDVYIEVRLKDDTGAVSATLRYPQKDANPWLRHRQELLARNLLDDRPIQPPAGEVIPAPGQSVRKIVIWDTKPDRTLGLNSVEEHRIPRDRPVRGPSELSLTLARSFARHLCRTHGAATAEIVRHSKDPVSPLVLFQPDVPPGATEELVASFGEMPR